MLKSKDYQKADRKAIQLLLDYSFFSFPIDVFGLADKLCIKLIKYSELDEAKLTAILSHRETRDGLTVLKEIAPGFYESYIYYNDKVSIKRQRFTIAHEIKHVIYQETNPDVDDETLADHFARVLLSPPCLLVALDALDPFELADLCFISEDCAINAIEAINRRISFRGHLLDNYEKEYLSKIEDKTIFRHDVKMSLSIQNR